MIRRAPLRAIALLSLLLAGQDTRAQATAPRATITVRVAGLRNQRGTLQLALFQSATGYPEENARAAHTRSVPIRAGTNEVIFDAVPTGAWALAVLHDENSNGRLDRNFLGIPTEGTGASNGAGRFGPPKFLDALFQLTPSGAVLDVTLRYWL